MERKLGTGTPLGFLLDFRYLRFFRRDEVSRLILGRRQSPPDDRAGEHIFATVSHRSRVHAAWCFQASRLRLVGPAAQRLLARFNGLPSSPTEIYEFRYAVPQIPKRSRARQQAVSASPRSAPLGAARVSKRFPLVRDQPRWEDTDRPSPLWLRLVRVRSIISSCLKGPA